MKKSISLDEIDSIIDTACATETEDSFRRSIAPLFDAYSILSLEIGRGNIFWRARKIDHRWYEHIDELDYPDPEKVKKAGRLNGPGESCFYISALLDTALLEVDAAVDQEVQVAGFRILSEAPLRIAVIGEYSNVQKNGYMHFVGVDPNQTVARMMNEIPKSDALSQLYIDRFLASVLSDKNAHLNDYLYSRALAKEIHSRADTKAVAFPSVKDSGGFNIGVDPDTSDECFHNVACVIARIKSAHRFGLLDVELLASAERLDDGKFVWMPKRKLEEIGIYNMNRAEYEAVRAADGDRSAMMNLVRPGPR
jgi:hypothetical protein